MNVFPQEAQQNARTFVFKHSRPLEQALYSYHFDNGIKEDVYKALAAFQNPDGGFGHALEPDMRAPESSALATSIALGILRDLQTPADRPLVQQAISYLLDTYDREKNVWRIIPETTDSRPHAPWWSQSRLEETFDYFQANPKAELVGYLWTYEPLIPLAFKQQLLDEVISLLDTLPEAMSGDMILCYVRLHATENLPQEARKKLQQKLMKAIQASIETDPEKWSGYCLKPLWVVTTPDSSFYDAIAEAVLANLDYEITTQCQDGSWTPNWNWAGTYPEDWKIAEQEWRGELVLRTLRSLRAFGRF